MRSNVHSRAAQQACGLFSTRSCKWRFWCSDVLRLRRSKESSLCILARSSTTLGRCSCGMASNSQALVIEILMRRHPEVLHRSAIFFAHRIRSANQIPPLCISVLDQRIREKPTYKKRRPWHCTIWCNRCLPRQHRLLFQLPTQWG